MRAIIDQRLAGSGFMGLRASYFIYVELNFSEEEKALIKASDLASYRLVGDLSDELNFGKRRSALIPVSELLGVLVAAGGLTLLVGPMFFESGRAAGFIAITAGVAILIAAKIFERFEENKLSRSRVTKLGDVLDKGGFFLEAGSAESAAKLEAKLRERFEEIEEELVS
jgi:hypothetical protein